MRRFRTHSDLKIANRADVEIVGLHHPVLLESPESIEEIIIALQKIYRHSAELQQWKKP
ncbi:MAG: hypothetical protein R3C11_10565 [Planctomycetaceae bacterium]